MPTREEMWNRLNETVDLLIIGGGINGAGIARDAARRGLSVAVCEMKDLAWGTSSRSSKLVHGGLRYLEMYEFSLVFESVSERRILLDIAPHLVNPLGFIFPVYKGARHSLAKIGAGMWLYEGLSLFRSPKRHRKLKRTDVEELEPALRSHDLKGAPLYYDCSTDDARLTLETAMDAAEFGAIIATRTKVQGFVKNEDGKITGAKVRCQLTGQEREITAHAVINATGPWTDATISMSKDLGTELLRPTKGIHIVVESSKVPVNNAVVCFHPTDKRTLFAIPWGDRTYIGTTDTDYEGDPSDVAATLEDVDYLIDASNAYFPEHTIAREDVIATWAGLRPLISPPSTDGEIDESAVSREHQIIVGQDGLITIAGGKLTTYRRMSAEVVDTAVKLLMLQDQLPEEELKSAKTHKNPLPGAVGWPEDDDHEKVAAQIKERSGDGLDDSVSRYLADTYGMRGILIAELVAAHPELAEPVIDGRPEIMAQVDYSVREELAATVSDFMIRRTQIFYRDLNQGLSAAQKVGARMGELIGWSDEVRDKSVNAYRKQVALSRAWKDEITAV